MSKYIIFGNYGNETIGLIEWVAQQQLSAVTVVSVDTQWAGCDWQQRLESAETWVREKGFDVVRLSPKLGFAELMRQQDNFPSPQYQWCAGFLKALPFIDWLDSHDPSSDAILLLGNRRALSQGQANLQEYIEESEHFSERKIWHPLYQHSDQQLADLIKLSGLEYLSHRSLECEPCVNNCSTDFKRMNKHDILKTATIEQQVGKSMFLPQAFADSHGIEQVIKWVEKNPESDTLATIDMGCGSPFACGL